MRTPHSGAQLSVSAPKCFRTYRVHEEEACAFWIEEARGEIQLEECHRNLRIRRLRDHPRAKEKVSGRYLGTIVAARDAQFDPVVANLEDVREQARGVLATCLRSNGPRSGRMTG
jgi:hypothetical protein